MVLLPSFVQFAYDGNLVMFFHVLLVPLMLVIMPYYIQFAFNGGLMHFPMINLHLIIVSCPFICS
jgi:hypothetical protein